MADDRGVLSISVESRVSVVVVAVVVVICAWRMEWNRDLKMKFVKVRFLCNMKRMKEGH
jgi:hypothetical protein